MLCGVSSCGSDLASEADKAQSSAIIEEKLLCIDAKIEQLIYDHYSVFEAIVSALEKERVLSRDDLLKIKENAAEKSAA